MIRIGQLLRDCDEVWYDQNSPLDAFDNLTAAVQADPEGAREWLQNLRGCPRTLARHRRFLTDTLAGRPLRAR